MYGVKLDAAISAAPELCFVESMAAMAVKKPVKAHPNKMPFSGVLTRLDVPSDKPPNGSPGGRRVIMRTDAAERAIEGLVGMGVNYLGSDPSAKNVKHEPTKKIGVITAASVKDGVVQVDDGHIYAVDFPVEAASIQASKADLGFSWEIADVWVEDPAADPLVITDFAFTGAAILRRDKAAYSGTSLAASAEEDIPMTKEEMAAALAEAVKPMAERLEKIETTMQASAATMNKVEPHAARLESAADKMDADGVGSDENSGHTKTLRAMASSMRADAAMGRIPSSYRSSMYASAEQVAAPKVVKIEEDPAFKALKDQLATATTKIADLTAASALAAKEPDRKTARSPEVVRFLSKHSVGEDSKMSASALDEALKGEDVSTRLRIKAGMKQAGLVES
jgi:hypothetical protein